MAKFDINKKGYDVDQVDGFINKLSKKYEEKLSEQKDRVFSLKNELAVTQYFQRLPEQLLVGALTMRQMKQNRQRMRLQKRLKMDFLPVH